MSETNLQMSMGHVSLYAGTQATTMPTKMKPFVTLESGPNQNQLGVPRGHVADTKFHPQLGNPCTKKGKECLGTLVCCYSLENCPVCLGVVNWQAAKKLMGARADAVPETVGLS
eukprot:TRINITY_DN26829_c0_g1_i1.p3 TRINITY_DN26829_c0_g1~~TRINITY_DN26829_c0_g1_i1.p3  ORF type:complete len:114 (-),score=9.82 TRINITY_DN26829_c0_g1_i1:4-345(-)